jgi:hypothetical protein
VEPFMELSGREGAGLSVWEGNHGRSAASSC